VLRVPRTAKGKCHPALVITKKIKQLCFELLEGHADDALVDLSNGLRLMGSRVIQGDKPTACKAMIATCPLVDRQGELPTVMFGLAQVPLCSYFNAVHNVARKEDSIVLNEFNVLNAVALSLRPECPAGGANFFLELRRIHVQLLLFRSSD